LAGVEAGTAPPPVSSKPAKARAKERPATNEDE